MAEKPDRVDVAEHAVDLTLHQLLLAQIGLHIGHVDLGAVELGDLAESWKKLERAITGRAANRFALEVFRRLDAAVGFHGNGEGRLIVHDIDGDRRFFGLLRREFDQRIDVAEADVVGAVGDKRDRSAGGRCPDRASH